MEVDHANPRFKRAVDIVNYTEKHLFLTGRAGTGKTTFLKYIREHTFKKLAVVAPTGVAAINAGGMTIHSFFQLPFGTFIANKSTGWNETGSRFYNTNQLLGKLRIHKKKRNLIRQLDLLIIDEVSMVRADILDAIDIVLRHIRQRHYEPFGGMQMVYIGDLFQLPPVVKEEEWQWMKEAYEGPFFFHSRAIQEVPPIYLELKKIYRQDDPSFISLLNNIRHNSCGEGELELLEQYYQPDFIPDQEDGYITLTTHNFLADRINNRELNKLQGERYQLKAIVEGDFPGNAFPADQSLELKEGAQIMFIKNDKGEDRRYYNGKTGRIEEIDTVHDQILIRFPGERDLLELSKETWRNVRYQYDEEKDNVKEKEIGTFKQFPLRLAWAVTIHKSQGLTFEKAIIDAGRAFAAGQVYVALSRLTSLDGMILQSIITPTSIQTDERVIAFARGELPEVELERILKEAQTQFLHRSVLAPFRWDKLLERLDQYLEDSGKRSSQIRLLESGWINKLRETLIAQRQVGSKFIPVLEKLLRQNAYTHLHERTQAGVDWFISNLDQKVIAEVDQHIKKLEIKPRTKKRVRLLKNLLRSFDHKKEQLRQAVIITQGLLESKSEEALLVEAEAIFKPKSPPHDEAKKEQTGKPVKGSSARISQSLFKEGKSIEEIAQMRELKATTILGHLASFIATGEIKIEELFDPDTISTLQEVIEKHPKASPSEIRSMTRDKFSYPAIQAVMALKKERE